jgi:hypothetical protein
VCKTKNRRTAPGAHDYIIVCQHTCFHTQGSTWLYCELCMLTPRRSGRQTRLPAASSSRCSQGGVPCGGEGRHAVRLTPVDTLSARAHARKQQQEVEEVKELQRRKSAKCPHSPRESKSGKYRDTVCKTKNRRTAPGAHDYNLCVSTHMHGATVNCVCLPQGGQADKRVIRQSRQGVVVKAQPPVGGEGDTRSGSHPSTPAQHERMRGSRSKRWNRKGQGQVKELQRRKSAKCPRSPRESKSENTGTQCVKRKTDALPLGHMTRCLCANAHASAHKQAHGAPELCMLTTRRSG